MVDVSQFQIWDVFALMSQNENLILTVQTNRELHTKIIKIYYMATYQINKAVCMVYLTCVLVTKKTKKKNHTRGVFILSIKQNTENPLFWLILIL